MSACEPCGSASGLSAELVRPRSGIFEEEGISKGDSPGWPQNQRQRAGLGRGAARRVRVRALIASHSSLTGELPRTNRTTRELRIGDVIDERGRALWFPMNECLTIGTDFRLGIPVFTIEVARKQRALLVSDLAPKSPREARRQRR